MIKYLLAAILAAPSIALGADLGAGVCTVCPTATTVSTTPPVEGDGSGASPINITAFAADVNTSTTATKINISVMNVASGALNTTTLIDSGLSLALDASTTYYVNIIFTCEADNATPDCKFGIAYDGASSTISIVGTGFEEPTGSASFALIEVFGDDGTFINTNAPPDIAGMQLTGSITTLGSGTLKLQFSQNSLDAVNETRLRAGSIMQAWKKLP